MDGLALSTAGCADVWAEGAKPFGLSLCAGAGGLDLGLHLAFPGYRTVGYVERDAYAAATLVARMEDKAMDCAPVWDDIATFDGKPWRNVVDIVHGGYPCQPFSVAGRRLGDKDPRHLWPHVARIVDECRPALCFFENVGGHLRLGFEQVHDDLRRMGYGVKAGLFTAEEVGAPHKRERLFILAYTECSRRRTSQSFRHFTHRDDQRWKETADRPREPGTAHMANATSQSQQRQADQTHAFTTEGRAWAQSGDGGGYACVANATRLFRQTVERREPHGDCRNLGDANDARLERRNSIGGCGDELPAWPPGPAQHDAWEQIPAYLKPAICRMADGMANQLDSRVDRLRLCGNGVVPLVAAYAFRTLASAANSDFNGK